MADPNLSVSTIIDFALGHLSPEESLRVQDQIERDPEASKTLELVLLIIEHFQQSQSHPSSN